MDNLIEEGENVVNSLVQRNIQLLILRAINHLAPPWESLLGGVGEDHVFHTNPTIWSTFELPILWPNANATRQPSHKFTKCPSWWYFVVQHPKPCFFQIFDPLCPTIQIFLSLFRTIQQPYGTPQWPLHLTPLPRKQPTHSQPTSQVTTNMSSQGRQSVSSSQINVLTTNKILLEPEGDT